jgi:uncharacterized protein YciI
MLFVMTCLDKANAGSLRADTRPAHLDFIRARIGHVVLAGPLFAEDEKTPIGSLLVAELDRFAAEDPYAKAGLFQSVTVRPFRKVFPEG